MTKIAVIAAIAIALSATTASTTSPRVVDAADSSSSTAQHRFFDYDDFSDRYYGGGGGDGDGEQQQQQTRIDRKSLDLFGDVSSASFTSSDGQEEDGRIDMNSIFVQLDLSKLHNHHHGSSRNLQQLFQPHGDGSNSGWSSLRVKVEDGNNNNSSNNNSSMDTMDDEQRQRYLMDMLVEELAGIMGTGNNAGTTSGSSSSNQQRNLRSNNNWRGVRKGAGQFSRSASEAMDELDTRMSGLASGKGKGSGKKNKGSKSSSCKGSGSGSGKKKGKKKNGGDDDDDDDDECSDNGVDAQCSIITDYICVAFPGHDMDQSSPVTCDRIPVGVCEATIQYIVAVFNPFVSDMPSLSPSVEPSTSVAPSTSSGKKGSGKKGSGKKGKGKTSMPIMPSSAPSVQPTSSAAPSTSSGKKGSGKKGKKGKDKGTDAPEHPEGTIVINNFLEMFARQGNSPSCTTEFDKIELPDDMEVTIQPGEVLFLLSSEFKINLCECPRFMYDLVTIASPKDGGEHCFDVIIDNEVRQTFAPSASPSVEPSSSPSLEPSIAPSVVPSAVPSLSQVPSGSAAPSPGPSVSFAPSLSEAPSTMPSSSPTSSEVPSASPSSTPSTSGPSMAPSLSMAPTTCTSESGNFQVEAQFVLQDNNYTNWFFELWSRPNVPGAPWVLEERKQAFETDTDAIFCINSPPMGQQYLVQTINSVDGMLGPSMFNGEQPNALTINIGTRVADDPMMTSNKDGAFSPGGYLPPDPNAPPNPVQNPAGEFGFGPEVDLSIGAVCQIGFTPGVVGSGCGSCRYGAIQGTSVGPYAKLFDAFSQDSLGATPPCPETFGGFPLGVPGIIPTPPPTMFLVPPMIP